MINLFQLLVYNLDTFDQFDLLKYQLFDLFILFKIIINLYLIQLEF